MSFKTPPRHLPLAALLLSTVFPGGSGAQGADTAAQDLPQILRSIENQGIKILGEMKVPGGLRAFAAKAGAQPLAIYLTPDNEHVVFGTLVDANGQDMATAQLKEIVEKPILEAGWNELQNATWVADGKDDAIHVVYTFTDPNCPYCNKFWQAARPWVESGKVQLRHIMVGVIRPDSAAKAAAILEADTPTMALTENELKHKHVGSRLCRQSMPRLRQSWKVMPTS
ncbi:thiol:disulfide interchange protein DsbG [Agrobacterium tumefaciens]|uniref:thiol:disulfide interchange protein DsbG n=1 Tax=Agrobacterium tumefaciens TaxID=358 RepID=UPI0021CE4314|nr:thiol:disulfide interchange protein DsbG [Agrobacterium tumefaciens]UXS05590.1 thiol:disulfide interchange protein DsbG [Agrobacterium tumefaciens]